MIATRPEAHQLMHDGAIALAQVEANGFKIDRNRLRKNIRKVEKQVGSIEDEMRQHDLWSAWRRMYRDKTNIDSNAQLERVLIAEGLMSRPDDHEEGKQLPTDADTLTRLQNPFLDMLVARRTLSKLLNTSLLGILNEVTPEDFVHCVMNLHIARTYRSSCDTPNLQNVPIRNPEIAQLIRECFIARSPRNHLVESDFGGIEVRVSACYHKDPVMLAYLEPNTNNDMHRDMAAQLLMITKDKVTKHFRHCSKNKFVFPAFYGSYFKQIAPDFWIEISKTKDTIDGLPAQEYLKTKGIKKLGACDTKQRAKPGTFEHHVQKVEEDFWGRRFKVYADWKETWYRDFLKRGYFETLTGFVIRGSMSRNDAINYPVQGSAFHCLLWSLIEIQKELRKRKMQTKLVCQIHDSVIADVPEDELEDYLEIVKDITTRRLAEHWKWIIVHMEIEADVSPLGESWHAKKAYDLEAMEFAA